MEKYTSVKSMLKRMVQVDQEMRNKGLEKPDEWDESIDLQNTAQMRILVADIGWPYISMVGYEGASNAWLLVQHADHDPAFQQMCLELMKSAPVEEVPRNHIAFLEDRIAVGKGLPQLFGTQFQRDSNGELKPHLIADPKNVDERRKKMWLGPLKDYRESMYLAYGK